MLGADERDDGALIRGGELPPAGMLRGGGPLRGVEIRDDAGGCAIDPPMGAWTVPLATGELSSCRDTLPRLRTLPRGTPKPAELPLNRILSWTALAEGNCVLRFTTKVCPGRAGGLGKLKVRGGFVIPGAVFHPAQELPGCQNHPLPAR